MTKKRLIVILKELKEFKARTGVRIVDTHVHPHDVMGIVHYSETGNTTGSTDFLKPGSLELLEYGSMEKIASRFYFKFFASSIDKMIRETYSHVTPETISAEQTQALVDDAVVLALDPWTPTDVVGPQYKDKEGFLILGSVDIHKEKLENIESKIVSAISNYKIKGIKLHSNLQAFKPQPKDNPPEIAEKLRKVYQVASNHGLYMLFHGGVSNYTETIHEKYGFYPRSKTYGVLENFCDENGKSELFENYTMPIVIAHLGHYGKIFHNYKLMKTIIDKYSNVYFDTSGVSPRFLSKALSIIPSSRIIFGSDAVYNRIAYNLAFVYEGVRKAKTTEKINDMLLNIMGRNYYTKVLQ